MTGSDLMPEPEPFYRRGPTLTDGVLRSLSFCLLLLCFSRDFFMRADLGLIFYLRTLKSDSD